MTPTVIILLIASLGVLLLGTYLWRLTSSRSIFMHTMFGTICMMLAAYHAAAHHGIEWAIMLPFFTTMLFGGRAMGTWWRSRKDSALRLPAQLMAAVAAVALTATLTAYATL
jgi:hypothetical protein